MSSHYLHPIRYKYVKCGKKSLLDWIAEAIGSFALRDVYNEEGEPTGGKVRSPYFPSWDKFKFSDPIVFGDPDYEKAEYEVGYIYSRQASKETNSVLIKMGITYDKWI